MPQVNKRKIVNDPVYGFIRIRSDFLYDLISHPYVQRLRRIRQMGLSDLVYPGAIHTRFHHALGAMHLMGNALDRLREKGHEVSEEEFVAAQAAILLHDVGHGPFSHVLESALLKDVHHEHISLLFMKRLSEEFGGALPMAVRMFTDEYPRRFFHQLVSSQLDMDRLDYLQRDCYYTGVSEGKVGGERLIRMLDIREDQIVIEQKGIYSVENFLTARRLMYWQVYLHKTNVSAEAMLTQIINRARYLTKAGALVPASAPLAFFLSQEVDKARFERDGEPLGRFALLDDFDIWGAVKSWAGHEDRVLSALCGMLLDRRLFGTHFFEAKPGAETVKALRKRLQKHYGMEKSEVKYMFASDSVSNAAYVSAKQSINVLMKDGRIVDVAQASDLPNVKALGKIVKKYYLSYPKVVSLPNA